MITLDSLQKDQEATVVNISAVAELKKRLQTFGVSKGTLVKVKAFSPTRNTMTISVNKTTMALRLEEAAKIEVQL